MSRVNSTGNFDLVKMRIDFESKAGVAAPGHSFSRRHNGEYEDYATQCAWRGFQMAHDLSAQQIVPHSDHSNPSPSAEELLWIGEPDPLAPNIKTASGQNVAIVIDDDVCQKMVDAYNASATVGAGELPPLPKAYSHIYPEKDGRHDVCFTPAGPGNHQPVYTAKQYREGQRQAIAAFRAQLKGASVRDVKTWQERCNAGEARSFREGMQQQIVDLTEQLARAHLQIKAFSEQGIDALGNDRLCDTGNDLNELDASQSVKVSLLSPDRIKEIVTPLFADGTFNDDDLIVARAIELEVRATLIPKGYVIVPIKLTDEMFVAFAETWFSKVRPIDDCGMEDCYAAMLAVAPNVVV